MVSRACFECRPVDVTYSVVLVVAATWCHIVCMCTCVTIECFASRLDASCLFASSCNSGGCSPCGWQIAMPGYAVCGFFVVAGGLSPANSLGLHGAQVLAPILAKLTQLQTLCLAGEWKVYLYVTQHCSVTLI